MPPLRRLPWILFAALCAAPACGAEAPIALSSVLGDAVANYEPLRAARLRADRARLELERVEGQLGWEFSASTSARRDLSLASTPSDTVSGSAGVRRALRSGGEVSFGAGVDRVDNGFTFSPEFPDPATTARMDLSVRNPLLRGAGNPAYSQGLATAQARYAQADADWRALRDDVATRALQLYFAAALTRSRIGNTRAALDRAHRLERFIRDNTRLGLSEQKDQLAVAAQVKARLAELDGLNVQWVEQRTALNRLAGYGWNREFAPQVPRDLPAVDTLDRLYTRAEDASPALLHARSRLAEARSAIEIKRDASRDTLDLVYSAGARQRGGDAASGDFNESDLVGGVTIEYRRALDRRGIDAELAQAQLDEDIARQDMRNAVEDAHYNTAGLSDQIVAGRNAQRRLRDRLDAEHAKLDEALERYRDGRIDTARLIDIEADLRGAELALAEQDIALASARARLDILTGDIWTGVPSPRPATP